MEKQRNLIYFIVAIASFLIAIHFGYLDRWKPMAIMAGLCGASLLFANLHTFETLTLGSQGVKLRRIAITAESNIKELQKEMASTLIPIILGLIQGGNRFAGASPEEKSAKKDRLIRVCHSMGISSDEIKSMLNEYWYPYVAFDMAYKALGGSKVPSEFGGPNPTPEAKEAMKEWEALRVGGIMSPPSPRRIREFWDKRGWLTPERKKDIEAYQIFVDETNYIQF